MSTETVAVLLRRKSAEIMRQWEERARKEVTATLHVSTLILQNALPRFLESLAIVLQTGVRTTTQIAFDAAETLAGSKSHGRGRAGLPLYLMSQVIQEYQILRQCIFECLEENGPLDPRERDIIITFTEQAVNVAATEFAAALKEVQEQFMLSLAHDLRSPLSTAKATLELSLRKLKAEMIPLMEQQQFRSIDRLNRMIERILDSTKIGAGQSLRLEFSDCDLQKLVLGAVDELKTVYGACIVVNAKSPVTGQCNSEYVLRAFENLIENAIKYRSPKSQVTVTVYERDENVFIEVHNEGVLISAEDQARIFEPHWRGKWTIGVRGWGFGLAFVCGVVEAHHGSIRVESAEGKGTTFIIELPKKQGKSGIVQSDRMVG